MWFDPEQLMKTVKSRSATLATYATLPAQPRNTGLEVAKIAEVATVETSHGWLLHFTDREPLEVYCNPDATHAEILERYPDALAAEPLPERTRREPTDAEAKELRALVQAVGNLEGWTTAEIEEATAAALADPDGALTCYRDIAADLGVILWSEDDRRSCQQCANLAGRRCLSAWRGEIVASRDYEPIRDLPRRCEGYTPGADDPDTRPGRERWPELLDGV